MAYGHECSPLPPAPAPSPAAPPPSVAWKTVEIVSAILGGTTAFVLALGPAVFHLYNGGRFESTAKLFNARSMLAALVNSIVWVLYSLAVLQRDNSVDLVMSNLCCLVANLHCLAFFYAHRRQNLRGYGVVAVSIISVLGMLVLQQVVPTKPFGFEITFGTIGCTVQLACHGLQIFDLVRGSAEKVELISVLLNVVPNMLLGIVSIIITYLRHPNQIFMNISGCLNFICYVVELFLILRMCDSVKNFFGSKRTGDDDIQLANLRLTRDTVITISDPIVSWEAIIDQIRALRNGQETVEERLGA